MKKRPQVEQTPLSIYVRKRLVELGINQSEFCRLTGFDQGLLSKIQSSMVSSLTMESALRLSLGLCVSPTKIFELLGRQDLHELIVKAYAVDMAELKPLKDEDLPPEVLDVCHMALRAYLQNHDIERIRKALHPLAVAPKSSNEQHHRKANVTSMRGGNEW